MYIKILIDEMKSHHVYEDEISGWDDEKVISSARMHDLGKISITDLIVNKPGKLTENEYEIIKSHAIEGERIIEKIISRTGEGEFLRNAKLFAGSHHEHWDGTGYPRGLKGEEIPLQGRIMATVDVYDALVSERPYKKAFTDDEAVRIIMDKSGTYYDPKITEVFYKVKDLFIAVRSGM
jgi:putative two-component system response regulator